jgi:hypothetical protein
MDTPPPVKRTPAPVQRKARRAELARGAMEALPAATGRNLCRGCSRYDAGRENAPTVGLSTCR